MTWRSILIGVLLAALVAVGGHFNDVYMGQTALVGNLFPISIVGVLLVLVLLVNPLLRRLRWTSPLRPAELAAIVALPFAVCVVPGSGFLRTLTPALVLPHHYEKMVPSWQQNHILAYFPPGLLAEVNATNEEQVLGAFLEGQGRPGGHSGLAEIPWAAWGPALTTWVPVFLALMLGLIGLALVLHRQWSRHEHLVYPVAEFVGLLTAPDSPGRRAVLASRLFWYGLAPIFVIHVVNGLRAWYPGFIEIPHRVDLNPLREFFPVAAKSWGGWALFRSEIYFSVVAFAYFLPSDITLSLGLTNLLRTFFVCGLITYGIPLTGETLGAGEVPGLMFGAFLAAFLGILVSGRAYYGAVLRAAFGRPRAGTVLEPSAVWGLRVFLAGAGLASLGLIRAGLPWPYAAALVLGFVVLFATMSRVCAETGLFFIQPGWQPVGVLLGLLGAGALGPQVIAAGALVCVVISIDPREAMMPFVANALRMADDAGLRCGRVAAAMGLTLVAGLLLGLVTVLWLQYDRGVGLTDAWGTRTVPRMAPALVDSQVQHLKADGLLERTNAATWRQRLALVRPNRTFLAFLATGFALYAGGALLRLRFASWPLHPVIFLVWFSYAINMFGASFLIGWAIKSLVVRFGGAQSYQQGKPYMLGWIAGDMLGGLVFMVVGAVYYAWTGFPPRPFRIFPG